MPYFPMFLELSNRRILVIGGGAVAERRVKTLLEFGAEIIVLSPEVTKPLASLGEEGKISIRKEAYEGGALERLLGEMGKVFFVLAAATEEINELAVFDCKRFMIPVNNASKKEQCDFYFPAVAKEGETVIGITSGGGDHKRAAGLAALLREWIKRPET